MLRAYRTINANSETEFVINRSRFIGRCFQVESEEEALALLSDIRKKHYDASHNCFAYRIGATAACARFSDDGEPGGTAGMPIMEVLTANDVTNLICIVTRYFGGILLGAGGLVRAYSKSAAMAVSAAGVLQYAPGFALDFNVDYARYGVIEAYVRENSTVDALDFMENVHIRTMVAETEADAFIKQIIERTDGRVTPKRDGEGYLKTVVRSDV